MPATVPRKLNDLEEHQILEMHVTQHMTMRQVAQVWNQRMEREGSDEKKISHGTVGNIVRRQLDALAESQRGMTLAYRQQHQLVIQRAMQVAWSIAVGSKCTVCNGEKTIAKDRLDPDAGNEVCPKCDGSGRNENEQTRLSAIGQIRGLLERHAKVFGTDAPAASDAQVAVAIAHDVTDLDDAALMAEVDGMFKQPDVERPAAVPALLGPELEPPE